MVSIKLRRSGGLTYLDFAFVLQLLHLFDSLLDRRLSVQTMGIVEIDHWQAQTLQRALTGLATVLGRAVYGAGPVLCHTIGKLCGKEDVLALARVCLDCKERWLEPI
jgi:hypothetical protein